MTTPTPEVDVEEQETIDDLLAEVFAAIGTGMAVDEAAETVAAALAIDVGIATMLLRLLINDNYMSALPGEDLLDAGTDTADILRQVRRQQGAARRQYVQDAAQRARVAPTKERWLAEEKGRFQQHVAAQQARRHAAERAAETAEQSGSLLMEWRTHRDSQTCKSCWDLHRRRFSVNDARTWPTGKQGHPVLPGANHPGCRCSAMPIVETAELSNMNGRNDLVNNKMCLTIDALRYEARGDWEGFVNEIARDKRIRDKLLAIRPELQWEVARQIKEMYRGAGYELSNVEDDDNDNDNDDHWDAARARFLESL